ncbi:hypothetical protein DB35_23310 [Streptomyces abyssalis]|uniref:DUF2516 domain-containing protein n=1 Tax=Streptomyces abyssalis TaxID=933944 RepID=A0A1E7JQZ8_9ACTN|nr:DUF2516 family protein [Streptomyces abyssalis]OEU87457.1 hypothetical protein DB35_23310 [Streptomyces abyssalis]OEU90688.1 hypothetical protein AN215_10215 [Streptomyces abyssalis]OEV28712.1 hypothetical protein AN219_20085 [Streptomyces nanshensis]
MSQGPLGPLFLIITLVLLAMAVFAFIDGAMRRTDAYTAAGKQTKVFWLIILGLTLPANYFQIVFLQIAGAIATIVYIVDVRPALKQVMGGGPKWGGSSSDGPYGPFNGR